MRTAAKRVLYFLIGVLVVFALVVDCIWIYTLVKVKGEVYFNFNVGTLGKVEGEEPKSDDVYVMEANYYSNAKQNGAFLQEVRFNTWTNPDQVEIYGYGMQLLKEGYESHVDGSFWSDEKISNWIDPNYCYYSSYTEANWGQENEGLPCGKTLQLDIKGTPYELKPKEVVNSYLFNSLNWIPLTWTQYTYPDVFSTIMKSIESCNLGYGDWVIPLDLTKYFDVKIYNEKTRKFDTLTDNGSGLLTVKVKYHYTDNGARRANQSLFGAIGYNPAYDLTGTSGDGSYSAEKVFTTLRNSAFDFLPVKGYPGLFAKLKPYVREALQKSKQIARVEILAHNIPYNGDYGSYFAGFAVDALRGIPVDTVRVGNHFQDATQPIYLLNGAFVGTGISRLTLVGDWELHRSAGDCDTSFEVRT